MMRRFCWSWLIIFFHRPVPKTERFDHYTQYSRFSFMVALRRLLAMKKNTSIRLAFLVLVVSIVLPVNGSVKHLSSNRAAALCAAFLTGSPLPAPPLAGLSTRPLTGSHLSDTPPPDA